MSPAVAACWAVRLVQKVITVVDLVEHAVEQRLG